VERAVVAASLARLVPDAGAEARAALVNEVFRNFAACFSDLITANRRPDVATLLASVEGAHHLAGAVDGRGAVILTAHVGNWELGGRLLAARCARPTHVVTATEVDPAVERFLRGGPAPVRFVSLTDPRHAVRLVAALRRREVVAMQGDRALGTRGDAVVRFLGADAPFPLGPFLLARAAGVPVLPAFCLLRTDRRYTIRLDAPVPVERGGEHAALVRWVAVLEEVARRHPEQWFNFFDLWSLTTER
jgi:KDO2-lipid IV(A) lauroyltransferase